MHRFRGIAGAVEGRAPRKLEAKGAGASERRAESHSVLGAGAGTRLCHPLTQPRPVPLPAAAPCRLPPLLRPAAHERAVQHCAGPAPAAAGRHLFRHARLPAAVLPKGAMRCRPLRLRRSMLDALVCCGQPTHVGACVPRRREAAALNAGHAGPRAPACRLAVLSCWTRVFPEPMGRILVTL